MSRTSGLAALAVAFVVAAWSCSGSARWAPVITITFDPGAIDDQGQSTGITVEGTDEWGRAGSGEIKVWAEAGTLKDPQSVTLDKKGKGTVPFSCAVASDPLCAGPVKISAEWKRAGAATTTNFRRIAVGDSVGAGGAGGGTIVIGGGTAGGAGGAGGGSGTDPSSCNCLNALDLTSEPQPSLTFGKPGQTCVRIKVGQLLHFYGVSYKTGHTTSAQDCGPTMVLTPFTYEFYQSFPQPGTWGIHCQMHPSDKVAIEVVP